MGYGYGIYFYRSEPNIFATRGPRRYNQVYLKNETINDIPQSSMAHFYYENWTRIGQQKDIDKVIEDRLR